MTPRLLLIQDERPASPALVEAILKKSVDLFIVGGMFHQYENIPDDHVIVADTSNTETLYQHILNLHLQFDAIGSFSESRVFQSTQLASMFGLIACPTEAVALSSHNKLAMRNALAQAGIQSPFFTLITELNESTIQSALAQFGTIVIKPVAGENSIGVRLIRSGDDLTNEVLPALRASVAAARTKLVDIDTSYWIAEQYIEGTMVSVDGFVVNGKPHIIGLVENELSCEPHFTIQANWLPSRLSRKIEKACFGLTLQAVTALGFQHCGFHCELKINDDNPVLIEIAARPPGGQLPAAYQRSLGIDLIGAQIDLWLGRPPQLNASSRIQIYQRGVFPRHSGVIKSVKGFVQAHQTPGVWQFSAFAQVGSPNVTYPAIPLPYYYYAVEGLGAEEVTLLAEQIERQIEIQLEPI